MLHCEMKPFPVGRFAVLPRRVIEVRQRVHLLTTLLLPHSPLWANKIFDGGVRSVQIGSELNGCVAQEQNSVQSRYAVSVLGRCVCPCHLLDSVQKKKSCREHQASIAGLSMDG